MSNIVELHTTHGVIRIELDTTRTNNWQEIDAVEMVGRDGSRQWAYATPVIQYLADDVQIVPGGFSEALDRSTNTITFRAESVVAAFWGDCSHGAVEIDLCNTCCTGGS